MHYWNLANYFNTNFIKTADEKTKAQLKDQLQKEIIPIIKKFEGFFTELEAGNKPKELTSFLKKEAIEVTPEVFWRMTKDERMEQIKNKVEQIQKCIEDETLYSQKLEVVNDDPNAVNLVETLSNFLANWTIRKETQRVSEIYQRV